MVKGFPKVDQLLSPSDWSLQIFICDTGISCTDWVLSLVPVINSEMDGKFSFRLYNKTLQHKLLKTRGHKVQNGSLCYFYMEFIFHLILMVFLMISLGKSLTEKCIV